MQQAAPPHPAAWAPPVGARSQRRTETAEGEKPIPRWGVLEGSILRHDSGSRLHQGGLVTLYGVFAGRQIAALASFALTALIITS